MAADSYVSAQLPGSPGGPLLFVFHGTGGNERQFLSLGRDMVPDATIVSPRGDVSEGGAARFFRRTGEGRYDMADLARATAKMAAFMQATADAANASRILALGYSNGANILASVMFSHPTLVERAVLMHPLIPFEPNFAGSLAGASILITAGQRDPICPPELTQRLGQKLRGVGADVTLDWHEGGHDIRDSEISAAQALFNTPDAAGRQGGGS